MSMARHHAEWLSLVETSGPFASMPVLQRVFPQGLDSRDTAQAKLLREGYEDWLDNGQESAAHQAWIKHVLAGLLEYPDELLLEGQSIPPGMEVKMPEFGETLRPDLVLKAPDEAAKPAVLIQIVPPEQDLDKPVPSKIWKASPSTRMMELLHGAEIQLGLITNGEQWMLVNAPRGETTGYASWYADLWMQEPLTLRAFHSLLCTRRLFGVAQEETLPQLLNESAKDQQEVTDQLGYQVRRAVEMIVQAIDRADAESGRTLLESVNERTLYEASLTVMMRLVFLFSAEERNLIAVSDRNFYDQHYAVSTLREQLRNELDEEVLARRHDAWFRLLATCRALHGGVEHSSLRLPPYGGNLFDPDRFPFLEGRAAGTSWMDTPAQPIQINNQVVLHMLEALQILRVKVPGGGPMEAQRLSFRSLDIEQIGHVYEGLLDHTVKRANEVVLGLVGKKGDEPEIPLSTLEEHLAAGKDKLLEFLKDETGKTLKALSKALEAAEGNGEEEKPKRGRGAVKLPDEHQLLIACGQDEQLRDRIRPFAGLLRDDDYGQLIIIGEGSLYVTAGSDRRSTGTHYTPRSLTEPIVQHTLEPLVYEGPAEGKPKEEWKLKSPREILALKVCDMAMGSGAFLVQTCRYLADRLVEAWELAEQANPGKILATPEGDFSEADPRERLIPQDAEERIAIARRFVADRCLYGVDINPWAVEMAKLSIWLITMQRDRPFNFLNHAFKCGDSLLGVSDFKQIENFSLRESAQQTTFATANLFRYVKDAIEKRQKLEGMPSNDYTQIELKNKLHAAAEDATTKLKSLADCLIAFELQGLNGKTYEKQRVINADHAKTDMRLPPSEFKALADHMLDSRGTFHWPVEFPEVFARGGFDAFVGNPPYMGGKKISAWQGALYRSHIFLVIANGKKGNADLCAFFLLRASQLLVVGGTVGFVATSSIAEGETREVGLDQLASQEVSIYRASVSQPWPGSASVTFSPIWFRRGVWNGEFFIGESPVSGIDTQLKEPGQVTGAPNRLAANLRKAFIGSFVYGEGFVISPEKAQSLIAHNNANKEVLFPYLRGDSFNSHPEQMPDAWVINFQDWPIHQSERYTECMKIVRTTVKPVRDELGKKSDASAKGYAANWWRYGRRAVQLYMAIAPLDRVLFHCFTSKYVAFDFVPANMVYAAPHVVIANDRIEMFGLLQSSIHEHWVRQHTSYLSSSLRYTPTDCFETFPIPFSLHCFSTVAESYHAARKSMMIDGNYGLTNNYNRFHDRGRNSDDIEQLRALHVELDQAVAAAYGWNDLDLGHGFHETKQGERYTISESARREVLDRLLALNHERYEEEVKAGLHDKKKGKAKRAKKKATKASNQQAELF
jgi:hypothetical protein